MARRSSGRLARSSTLAVPIALLVAALMILMAGEATVLHLREDSAPLGVSIQITQSTPTEFSALFQLVANQGSIVAHVALLPGEKSKPVSQVLVFYDPAFTVRFANPSDVIGLTNRLADYLHSLNPSISVSTVDSAGLPDALAGSPNAALVIFGYGTLPDDVFSHNVTLLKTWIEGGGILIWAGGPLAYFEGHSLASGGFQHEDLGWNGQVDLAGFQLEDPIGDPAVHSSGPLTSTTESPLGYALGIQYPGTADGANVTELEGHNGSDVGFDSNSTGKESPRTSLAYIPVGQGGIYYFGGAIWGTGFGVVPEADTLLSGDMALLIGTGYRPSQGPEGANQLTVGYLKKSSDSLSLIGPPSHVTAEVTSTIGTAYLFIWSEELA